MVGVDLSPYVPRVATEWASETPEARSKTVDGTMVFADISGFTALSERLAKRGPIGAEELTGVLGECFAGLLAVAYAEGGGLVKFGGDALLLLFDGPAHEVRATRAALGMRASIRTVGRLKTSVGNVRLRMSQGVHSGDIDLYRVGDSHDELIVCGPAASDVIRMESAAGPGEIIVSPATAAVLRNALPAVLGEPKGPGILLRPRTLVHVVEGYPVAASAPESAARAVPVAVREHLAQGGAEPEHRHGAIAFVRFDGVDGLRVRSGVDAVADALDELTRVVQSAVEAEEVTFLASDIDKDGGKIILVSGAPATQEDAEGRLLRAVRRIADSETTVPVRIGVNRGHVFAGPVGPPYRRTYTVMGDAVNLAARLMAKAAPGEIVAHPSVLELSRTAFATAPMDPFLVKGKAAPVTAVLVGDMIGIHDVRAASLAPLIGRDQEMSALMSVVVERPRVCEIIGETGLGKTRLLRELRERAPYEVPVRIVNCEQYERSTPYFSIGVLVRHVLGLQASATAAEVERAVAAVGDDLLQWLALIGDTVDVAIDDTPSTARLQSQRRRTRAAEVVAALLTRALPSGAVLAFDDVQWIDDASREVLLHLSATIDERPFSVVTTRRPQIDDDAGEEHLLLTPLSEDDARTLVVALVADDPLPPHRVDAVVRRSAGNPLFIEELTHVARSVSSDDLPDSLETVIGAQVDALPPRERRQLRYAAVLGESFDPSLFADVVADDSLRSPDAIAHRLGGLLTGTTDGRVQFRHRLIRDVAYRTLPFGVRRDLHARAAQVLERLANHDGVDRSEVLSFHCLHAQQFEKCWAYATSSAERAADKYALVEACDLYERAIAAAKHLPAIERTELFRTWRALGVIRQMISRPLEARVAFDRAARLAPEDPPRLGDIYLKQAELAQRSGHNVAAMRWVKRGLRLVEARTDAESRKRHANLLVQGATVRLAGGNTNEAIRFALDAVRVGETCDDEGPVALASYILVQARMMQGTYDVATARRALELFERLDSLENVAGLQVTLGTIAFWEGRWEDAVALYEESRTTFETIGALVEAAIARGNIAEVLADQGRLDEAEQVTNEVLVTWRSLRHPVGAAIAERYLGRIELRRGRAAAALERFERLRDTFSTYGMTPKVTEMDVWMAECRLSLGDGVGAVRLLESSLAHVRASGSVEWLAMIHRLRGYAALARGRTDDAWAAANESLAIAQSRGAAYDLALALELMSLLAERDDPHRVDPALLASRHELLDGLGVSQRPAPPLAVAV